MAVIDVAGFVADLKDHAADHGFHIHDERHFVETYSLRQVWEIDLHPELRGPAGTIPMHRPSFARYVLGEAEATWLEDFLRRHHVPGSAA